MIRLNYFNELHHTYNKWIFYLMVNNCNDFARCFKATYLFTGIVDAKGLSPVEE
jgi:hypothetical protein